MKVIGMICRRFLVLTAFLAALAQAALIPVEPALDFGYVEVGNYADRSVTITNMGNYERFDVQLDTTHSDFFVIDTNCPDTLAIGQSCDIKVRFQPSHSGETRERLTVLSEESTTLLEQLSVDLNGSSFDPLDPDGPRYPDRSSFEPTCILRMGYLGPTNDWKTED